MTVRTFCGDCLEVMDSIEDSSVDMILTDLPYGVLNKDNEHAKWDRALPFDRMWKAYNRVAKEEAPIILFGQGMFSAELMESNKAMWRYNLIWEKDRPTGFLNANRMPLRSHEDIMVFYRKLPVYNPQMVPCKPSERCHPVGNGKHRDANRQYGNFDRLHQPTIRDEKFPKSVIRIPKEHECKGNDHPTQKPVALCEYLIRTYTDEGMTVMDSCMGSGTTGVACVRTDRSFIGIEADPEYYAMAVKRINEAGATVLDNGIVQKAPTRPSLETWGLTVVPPEDASKEGAING